MSRFLWVGLVLLTGSTALAQQSYRRTVVKGKMLCLAWGGREYVYHYDAQGSTRTPGDTEFAAMEAAFDTWRTQSALCSDFVFTRGPDVVNPRVGYVKATEAEPRPVNENVILYREISCDDIVAEDDPCRTAKTCGNEYGCWSHPDAVIGLTTSTHSVVTGEVLDSDIELNGSQPGGSPGFLFTTVDSPPCSGAQASSCVAVDIQNTLTHELGHVMGLDHVTTPGSTMEASAPPGETRKRVLDVGSAEGFCTIYPRGLPPTQCLEPREKGLALTGDTRLGCAAGGGSLASAALLSLGALLRAARAQRRGSTSRMLKT
ncbi:hypothetical protein P2318_22435 [Myxococcaceae bacterium GXIMD 01537]